MQGVLAEGIMDTLDRLVETLKGFSLIEGSYADRENSSYLKREEGIVNDVIEGVMDVKDANLLIKREQGKSVKRIARYIIDSKQVNLVFNLKMQGFKTLHLC